MKIVIGNDHKGTKLKNKITKFLEKYGYEINDIGTNNEESVNYPDYGFRVGESVSNGKADFGIVICGTGIGISIAANKVKGIRCALVNNCEQAYLTRQHNNANVLALSSKISFFKAKRILTTFLETPFSNDQRHIKRVDMIRDYEEK